MEEEIYNAQEQAEWKYVYECLERSKDEGLQTEVVRSALEAMKSNSMLSVQEAMAQGMREWDC